jgi:hypothetical protein
MAPVSLTSSVGLSKTGISARSVSLSRFGLCGANVHEDCRRERTRDRPMVDLGLMGFLPPEWYEARA